MSIFDFKYICVKQVVISALEAYLQTSFSVVELKEFKFVSGMITDLNYQLEVRLRSEENLDAIVETERIKVSGLLVVGKFILLYFYGK